MDNHWTKPRVQGDGVMQNSTNGDRLVSGKTPWLKSDDENNVVLRTNTIADIESLVNTLPNDIRTYVYGCLEEHSQAIWNILALGYEAEELFFRDYLSWPRNEITSHELNILKEAFKDDRYELVPTIRFANRNLENKEDDIAETSSLFIEFHKRGMAF